MRLTKKERDTLWYLRHKFANVDAKRALDEFTRGITATLKSSTATSLYRCLAAVNAMKSAFQQIHEFNHTLGMLAAKAFLERTFRFLPWEEIDFARGANSHGPDIYVDRPPVKIVGELKTTNPCGWTDLGTKGFSKSQQKAIFRDLQKISNLKYDGFARYMFVTSPEAYGCLVQDYRRRFSTIHFVLLTKKSKVSQPLSGSGQS